jgi:hypothetical protein
MLKCHCPSECVVMKITLSLDRVLKVAYIVTIAHPALLVALCLDLGVHQWLHAMVIQRVWLHQIYNVELVGLTSSSVAQTEVEPLGLTLRKEVWPQN